jgi:1-acyl-sn-glycerol-3-phosphate acyltransferase
MKLHPHAVFPFALQTLAWPFGRFLLHFFGRLEVRGKENLVQMANEISDDRGVIFACSHTSNMDPVTVLAGTPPFTRLFPMFYVARRRKEYTWKSWKALIYWDWFFWAWGAHPIESGMRDYEKALVRHINILKQGHSLTIFPQGKLVKDGEEKEPRGGAAYLAEVTRAFVVPTYISSARPLSSKNFFSRKNKLTISYGVPFLASDFISNDLPIPDRYQNGAVYIMEHIKNLSKNKDVS